MATLIRPEISVKNKYYIDKHRHYELKHFCLQYPLWKKAYSELDDMTVTSVYAGEIRTSNTPGDPTMKQALLKRYYMERMELVESVALRTDRYLHKYILKAVTEGLSYTQLNMRMGIPCGKDMYYDRYRKFFWLLSHER